VEDLAAGLRLAGQPVTHLVVGVATVGGRLPQAMRPAIVEALGRGINVDSGLHQFLGDDPEFAKRAAASGARLRDVRRPPARHALHFYTGKIREVGCPRIAVLGTDCAVGKRTTAWLLVQALESRGIKAEMIGTGQTAWMQGARFGFLLDSTVNDFVSGEIEHAVWSAWTESRPRVIVIEGQGTLIHPAYPGGFEILGAARPQGVILQHAPGRAELEGFPGEPVAHPSRHAEVIRLVSGAPTLAVAMSREGIAQARLGDEAAKLAAETGLPVFDPLEDEGHALAEHIARTLGLGRAAGV